MSQEHSQSSQGKTGILQHIMTIRSGCGCGCTKKVALDAAAPEEEQVVIFDGAAGEIRMSREQFRRFVDLARAGA